MEGCGGGGGLCREGTSQRRSERGIGITQEKEVRTYVLGRGSAGAEVRRRVMASKGLGGGRVLACGSPEDSLLLS